MSALSFVEASVVVVLYHKHNPETFGEEGPFALCGDMFSG
jgi:hypothetical protein